LRAILAKLDAIDDESGVSGLTVEDVTSLRRQLHDGQNLIRETLDRLRQSQEESEMNTRRRDEIETRLAALETEYEELIGESIDKGGVLVLTRAGVQRKRFMMRRQATSISRSPWLISRCDPVAWGELTLMPPQNKLEAQYAGKRQAHESEVQDLRQQLELKTNEIRSLNTSIDGLKGINEELKVCHFSIRWLARQVRSLIAE